MDANIGTPGEVDYTFSYKSFLKNYWKLKGKFGIIFVLRLHERIRLINEDFRCF